MTAEFAHDAVAMRFRVLLDRSADVPENAPARTAWIPRHMHS